MKHTRGFSLMAALFILVVLTVISAFTVSIAGMSRNTASFAMQGLRAYFAARSGLEWGVHTITNTPSTCPADTTLTLTQGGLKGFNVRVTCAVTSFVEGTANINNFVLTSLATKGSFGDPNYVSREMQITVALPF